MENLRIVVIGCGDHANRFIYPGLAALPRCDLAAVCALDADQAERTRLRHGALRAYTDYQRMMETERPAAAVIVGPPRLHYEAGRHCLERGVPFFIEKPPGENLEQARELADLARRLGGRGQVGFMMRHSAVAAEIRTLAEAEGLDRPRYGVVKYFTSGPYREDEVYGLVGTDDDAFLWRYLLVQAVHPVNLAASFLDGVVSIRPQVRFSGENLMVEIALDDRHGARMLVLLHTFVAPGYGNLRFETELYYDARAMLYADAFSALTYYPARPPARYLADSDGYAVHWRYATFGDDSRKMGFATELEVFLNAVRGGAPAATDLDDAAETMRILTETHQMALQG